MPQGARRKRPTGGRRKAIKSRSGAEDGDVRITLAKMAGWIDVDAHMRFNANEESQAQILFVNGYKDMRYRESFHGTLLAA